MDSRSQLDILGDEDTTLLHMSRDLDDHVTQLRKNVLESVTTIRSRIHQQSIDLIEGERQARRDHERRLLAQIDNLQILLGERDRELARERLINERLIGKLHRQHTSGATRKLAKEALRQWHGVVVNKKYRQKLSDHLLQVRKERESRKLFNAWRLASANESFAEIKEKMEGDHRRAIAKISNEHHSSENKMQLEMLAMKEQLSKEEEQRAILEERLKAAFMRGVCALNMEAMHVLRNSDNAENMSVASLLQNMNITAGLDTTSISNEPGTTDRLIRQQQELQDQLNAMAAAAHARGGGDDHVPHPEYTQPKPQPRGMAMHSTHAAATHRPASASGPVVQLNPNYPASHVSHQQRPSSQTRGKPRPAQALSNTPAATGRRWQ